MSNYKARPKAIQLPDGTFQIFLTKGHIAFVDPVDSDLAQLNWSSAISGSKKVNYAAKGGKKGECFSLHRVILSRMLGRELSHFEQVDHKDNNGLNNRRSNLRLATGTQNNANQSLQRNNTSGYKGVTYRKDTGKWVAQTKVNGKRIGLGCFNSPEEAHRAYCEKMKELHGDFFRSE
jgi:hypothetical protein